MEMSRYLELFLVEAREHLEAAGQLALQLQRRPQDAGTLRGLFRHAHSIKGMAATMGYGPMVDLAHALEDLLDVLRSGQAASRGSCAVEVADALACLGRMLCSAERGETPDDPQSYELIRRLREAAYSVGACSPGATSACSVAPLEEEDPGQLIERSADSDTPAPAELSSCWRLEILLDQQTPILAASAALLLGRLGELGRLVHINPPMFTLRTGRFAGRLTLILDTPRSPEELEAALHRFPEIRSAAIRPEPKPRSASQRSGLSRKWVRVRADLLDILLECTLELILERSRLEASLGAAAGSSFRHLDRCELLLKKLYGNLMELRLVSFDSVGRRLSQGVRELAAELGKQVDFHIEGRQVRLDRSILDALVDPLLHMLRNALDHGIESPEERRLLDKPRAGAIRLCLERQGDRVHIIVDDDGRGLQVDTLRRSAVERGHLSPAEAARLSDAEAYMLITLPGFSTARWATLVSGRGVGMDVVRQSVESLGGRLTIRSDPGRGTSMQLSLPFTLAMIQALLVRCAGELYAVPISMVERTVDLASSTVEQRGDRKLLLAEDDRIELVGLADRLGLPAHERIPPGKPWALVFAAAERTLGLVVDEVLGRKEIVVRPLEAPLKAMRQYAGAALLEDGVVALVLDPVQLASAVSASI